MANKVALDKLDIEEPELLQREEAAPVVATEVASGRKLTLKRMWIPLLAAGLALVLALTSYFWFTAKKAIPLVQKKKLPVAGLLSKGRPLVNTTGFFVLLKDDKGEGRVLTYDLAFELYDGQEAGFLQNILQVRRAIYETVSKKHLLLLTKTDAKNVLKEEINAELNRLLGSNVIKAVYFTKYLIL